MSGNDIPWSETHTDSHQKQKFGGDTVSKEGHADSFPWHERIHDNWFCWK